jgi:hypothetical protein
MECANCPHPGLCQRIGCCTASADLDGRVADDAGVIHYTNHPVYSVPRKEAAPAIGYTLVASRKIPLCILCAIVAVLCVAKALSCR